MSLPANQLKYARGFKPRNPFEYMDYMFIAFEEIDFKAKMLAGEANETVAITGSIERETFTLPDSDDGYEVIKRYNRFRGGSSHNAGRKPRRHIKFRRKELAKENP